MSSTDLQRAVFRSARNVARVAACAALCLGTFTACAARHTKPFAGAVGDGGVTGSPTSFWDASNPGIHPASKPGTQVATGAPGGCVLPGETNEFRLPECVTPSESDAGVPPLSCTPGFDEFGRPVCLSDAGAPLPPPALQCHNGGLCQQILVAGDGQLDVLFMVDDSGSMGEEQAALTREMPRLIRVLTSGDLDADGKQDFPAVKDLHLGVVSSDMGVPGSSGIGGCTGLGDDGLLQNTPSASLTGCAASYPRFLSYDARLVDPNQAASDFACIATLGTSGCGFEHPLESMLKAITPASSDVRFLALPPSAPATTGHADDINAGFVRRQSLLALVAVTDEDDCSAREPRIFTATPYLDPQDPLYNEPLNLRCFYNKPQLFDPARYIANYQALRPPGANLVLFAAIVGVPPQLVDASARAKVDFSDASAREAYYDALLADPGMQERVSPSDANLLVPSCDTSTGRAYPPRRIVEVARGFGDNAVVQSICQASFAPALQPIVDRITQSLTSGCLRQRFARDPTGKIACQVIWELPAPGTPSASLQLCDERAYLSTPADRDLRTSSDGRARCVLAQVAVSRGDAGPAPAAGGLGWYYDDFSSSAIDACGSASDQRIVFTTGAEPPADVRVYVDCEAKP